MVFVCGPLPENEALALWPTSNVKGNGGRKRMSDRG